MPPQACFAPSSSFLFRLQKPSLNSKRPQPLSPCMTQSHSTKTPPPPTTPAPLSALSDVSLVVGNATIISSVTLELNEGEIVAVLGPSGSGKSTLLRILTGLQAPTSGRALYHGAPFSGTNPGAAIVFQSFALYPWLNILENVMLGLAAPDAASRAAMRARAIKAIDMIGLDGYENAYPRELSGGMRQRAGFARALVTEPEILCLDEPFSALDVLTAENLRSEVLRLWQSGEVPTRSILIITHGIEEAIQLADRLVILERDPGRIRTIIHVNLAHPRNSKSDAFQDLADRVYATLTAEDFVEEEATSVAAQEEPGSAGASSDSTLSAPVEPLDLSTPLVTTQQVLETDFAVAEPRVRYPQLPGVRIASVAGLLSFVKDEEVDLFSLEQRLQLDVDDLYPIVEAAEILGLLTVDSADVSINSVGRLFVSGSIDDRKAIVREAIVGPAAAAVEAAAGSRLVREILHLLMQARKGGRVPQELIFDTILLKHFSPAEARKQLEIAIEWGRFAELYAYESLTGSFFIEAESEEGEESGV